MPTPTPQRYLADVAEWLHSPAPGHYDLVPRGPHLNSLYVAAGAIRAAARGDDTRRSADYLDALDESDLPGLAWNGAFVHELMRKAAGLPASPERALVHAGDDDLAVLSRLRLDSLAHRAVERSPRCEGLAPTLAAGDARGFIAQVSAILVESGSFACEGQPGVGLALGAYLSTNLPNPTTTGVVLDLFLAGLTTSDDVRQSLRSTAQEVFATERQRRYEHADPTSLQIAGVLAEAWLLINPPGTRLSAAGNGVLLETADWVWHSEGDRIWSEWVPGQRGTGVDAYLVLQMAGTYSAAEDGEVVMDPKLEDTSEKFRTVRCDRPEGEVREVSMDPLFGTSGIREALTDALGRIEGCERLSLAAGWTQDDYVRAARLWAAEYASCLAFGDAGEHALAAPRTDGISSSPGAIEWYTAYLTAWFAESKETRCEIARTRV